MRRALFYPVIPGTILFLLSMVIPLASNHLLIHEKFLNITWLLFMLSVITNYLLHSTFEKNQSNFINYFFISFLLRFFVSLGIIAIYVIRDVGHIRILTLNFFFIYFFYLLFEIYFLFAKLQANSK